MENKTFTYKNNFVLESGQVLENLTIQYSTFGKLNSRKDNVIWVCHALTANSEVHTWWYGLVGEDKFFNPEKHFIVCANILGSCYGTSGPLNVNPQTGKQYFLDFPQVTIRDMVNAHIVLKEELGISKIHSCIGGSLGGQQAMEWAIIAPDTIENLILLATNAFHSPWGIAFNESQRMAIQADSTWQECREDAGQDGLKAARAIALLSYRNYNTYVSTQKETDDNKLDNYKASSYQNYQGVKLVNRFNCHSYLYLSKAMDSHHVGRGRGGAEVALKAIKSNTLVIGIKTDILFPVCEQIFLAQNIVGAEYQEIDSLYGHDGFLIETEKIAHILKDFYKRKTAAGLF
ncbi:MAG: homoserine O-acetyltransferase [Sporocytophaga sp.]|uniref:homoserine O-acetyltransferase family protein n=1 Tax=Sporocytophaga sp. TaxID=2231183 RepID=UPI001B1D7231|nr:homoserine O-acetyltransferase [Sporocytophaga sp.]MBO9701495.1 homoserine O-acetyltransferase [Sporocytophaga sp.]